MTKEFKIEGVVFWMLVLLIFGCVIYTSYDLAMKLFS